MAKSAGFGSRPMKLLISAATFAQYLQSGMCQLELVPMADKVQLRRCRVPALLAQSD